MLEPMLLVRDMRPSQLNRWFALADVDPWDENRADLRAGTIAAAAVNAAGAKKELGGAFGAEDFMHYHWRQQDPDELQRRHNEDVSAAARQALLNVSGHRASKDRDHLKEP